MSESPISAYFKQKKKKKKSRGVVVGVLGGGGSNNYTKPMPLVRFRVLLTLNNIMDTCRVKCTFIFRT